MTQVTIECFLSPPGSWLSLFSSHMMVIRLGLVWGLVTRTAVSRSRVVPLDSPSKRKSWLWLWSENGNEARLLPCCGSGFHADGNTTTTMGAYDRGGKGQGRAQDRQMGPTGDVEVLWSEDRDASPLFYLFFILFFILVFVPFFMLFRVCSFFGFCLGVF
ncbi:hypothetical protein M758_2G047900 [Ceratodon purpureus]|nr:hypothetical protein M758_2G047900 [Ceratodon purpureus]